MRQSQFYKYAAIALLVLNLAMLAFFFLTKPKRGGDTKMNAQSILHLDEQQHDIFLKLANEHMQTTSAFNESQRRLLQSYFNNLLDASKPAATDSLIRQVLQLEQQKIKVTYKHYEDVKSLLKSDQEAYFEGFMKETLKFILSAQKKGPPPPKDF